MTVGSTYIPLKPEILGLRVCSDQLIHHISYKLEHTIKIINFHLILILLRKHDTVLDTGLNRSPRHAQYISPQIHIDSIRLIGQQIKRSILADVCEANWFYFIADETPDVSHIEQVRYSSMPIDQIVSIMGNNWKFGSVQFQRKVKQKTGCETPVCSSKDTLQKHILCNYYFSNNACIQFHCITAFYHTEEVENLVAEQNV